MFVWVFLRLLLSAFLIMRVSFSEVVIKSIEYADLLGGGTAGIEALKALTTNGALHINGIPGLRMASEQVFAQEMLECLEKDGDETVMIDGTKRFTTAAVDKAGVLPRHMSSKCGDNAWELRLLVDAASKLLFKALDSASSNGSAGSLSPNYNSLSAITQYGEHLEHLHLYIPTKKEKVKPTMLKHTDAGLMIAMVGEYGSAADLQLELPWGEDIICCDQANSDTITFLVGEGLAHWLDKIDKNQQRYPIFRPVPHALRIYERRAWFGKMFMAPSDSFVHTSMNQDEKILFSDFRSQQIENAAGALAVKSIAKDNRILTAASSTQCKTQTGKDGILCWAQCVDITDISCSDGTIECVEFSTGTILDGSDMCPDHSFNDCGPTCMAAEQNNKSSSYNLYDDGKSFCYGDGVTMYMDGFRSIFEKSKPLCVNVWKTTWTLNTKFKFWFGVIGALFAGASIEILIALRRRAHACRANGGPSFIKQFSAKCTPLFGRQRKTTIWCDFMCLFLHFCQCVLGYLTMFLAMTYNVELFISVCLGATIAHFLLNFDLPPTTNDPCCAAATQSELINNSIDHTYLQVECSTQNNVENPLLPSTTFSDDNTVHKWPPRSNRHAAVAANNHYINIPSLLRRRSSFKSPHFPW